MDGGEPPGRRFSFLGSTATEEYEYILPKMVNNGKFISVTKRHTLNTDMGLGILPPVQWIPGLSRG